MEIFQKKTIFLIVAGICAAGLIGAADFKADNNVCEDAAMQKFCDANDPNACQEALKKCLAFYEDIAKVYNESVKDTQAKSKTLSGEISIIQSKIKKLANDIAKNSLMIKDLGIQVKNTSNTISETERNIDNLTGKLRDVLVEIYKEDVRTPAEIFFSGENLTESVDNFIAFKSISYRNEVLLQNIEDLKTNLEKQKEQLNTQKDELEDSVAKQEVQKNQNLSLKEQKNQILTKTKGEEALYKKFQTEAEQKATKIRAQIFELAGGSVSGISKAPSFGEAIEFAKQAGNAVGVRPAFILGIFAQETRIGKNVGRCYVADDRGYGANGKPVMSPKQTPSFISICNAAGIDFTKTPVSCPAPQIGCKYGGAMGPAQFMPTTWDLFKDQIASYVGHAPNPWNTLDAFYAAALFVKDAGATASGSGELRAASRYFGSSKYGYQNQVAVKADCVQTFMDQGTMSSKCESLLF